MNEWIDLFIVALLPLTALFTVLQKQPYAALVSRGILGAVAVLLYAVMGAPDVALTEALVGTLLTVILYAITVRSTQVLRLGMLSRQADLPERSQVHCFCSRHSLMLRKMTFKTEQELGSALKEGHVDAVLADPALLSSVIRTPPAELSTEQQVAVVAEHGRWHEQKMKEYFAGEMPVLRITSFSSEDSG